MAQKPWGFASDFTSFLQERRTQNPGALPQAPLLSCKKEAKNFYKNQRKCAGFYPIKEGLHE